VALELELESWPETELVLAAKSGDARAFGILYDRHADRVYRHIVYRIGRSPDAEDLLQQAFLKAWQALPRYTPTEAPFLSWLLVIAHNGVISYFRSRKGEFELKDDLPHQDDRARPDTVLDGQQRDEAVRQAISRLKPEYQQVVVMRYLEDQGFADIARQLGKSIVTVRVLLHRALRSMRKHLTDMP
jgi:RNA polymerase sigma factor (sigma-70 family)